MQRTLLLIPHEIAGIPIFGIGWVLIALAIAFAIRLFAAHRGGGSPGQVVAREGALWAIAILAVVLILPRIELQNLDGEPIGMAIRGYGVMLLLGVGSAVGLAAHRARRAGIDPDVIFAMAPWVFFGGILGARLFYVIQYRDQFDSFASMLKFTEGGLVVYGSFIGGFLTAVLFLARRRLPVFKLGDAIVPCMFLGVFFGRIGCLMNGCCYGGRCEPGWSAIEFPPTSSVYQDQINDGQLLGFQYDPTTRNIESVRAGSLADQSDVKVGSRLDELGADYTVLETASPAIPAEDVQLGVVATIDGRRLRWTPAELPKKALPVQAAQIISSVSSLLLCLALCGLSFFHFRDGTVMFLGFASYAVLRFFLEWIRVDEAGQFGTNFSISQWVSSIVLLLAIMGLAWLHFRPSPLTTQPQLKS